MKSVLHTLVVVVSIFAFSLAVASDHSTASVQEKENKSDNAKDRKAKGRKQNSAGKNEVATLAGGCFWCLEAVYNDLRGVEKVVSGYSGGHVVKPTYEQVTKGNTGHAEVVQLTFDPQVISYKELLEVFFTIHDPTTLNRQGADVGPQYRSAIFYHSPEQKAVADKTIADISAAKIWNNPIVTEVTKFEAFYPAEAYHQRYYERNPNQAYCRMVIEPKVIKFRKQFYSKLKKQ
jgi:peptide-methionine (S)-S-oxide reductase